MRWGAASATLAILSVVFLVPVSEEAQGSSQAVSANLFSQLLGTWDGTVTATVGPITVTASQNFTVEPLGSGGLLVAGTIVIQGEPAISTQEFLFNDGRIQSVDFQSGAVISSSVGRWTVSGARLSTVSTVTDLYGTYTDSATTTLVDALTLVSQRTSSLGVSGQFTARKRGSAATPGQVKADFNGDGRSDILWRNLADGHVHIWGMSGAVATQGFDLLRVVDQGWQIGGVGDFTGDGKADILWRHAVLGNVHLWQLDGTTPVRGIDLQPVGDMAWQICGVGDLTGDGKADVLWRNSLGGQVHVWEMNGTTQATGVDLPLVLDGGWKIQGVGDFTGDGKADILWRHTSVGSVHIWAMNGTTPVQGIDLPTVTDQGWQIGGALDLTADGKTDILWRHSGNGAVHVWEMNGTTPVRGIDLPAVTDPNWQIFNR
jgi:hypothetical protein